MTAVNQLNKHISLNKSLLLLESQKVDGITQRYPETFRQILAVTDVV